MLYSAQRRSKISGLECTITIYDIVIPSLCPVLGTPIARLGSKKYRNKDSPSLDRIDTTKGYTKENVCVISWRANRLKSDASIEEIERILQYMKDKTNA